MRTENRRQGYAYVPGYVHLDALGVAEAVRDARGEVVAAPAVIVPNEAGASSVVPVVRTAASGVSRALGAPATGTGRPREPGGPRTAARRPYEGHDTGYW
ncbi:hypothetical protein [Streptomyces sp. LBL]|uniref:hypothetical protein n=1 Tax=Streptomyces sp. LBL TaxID=2940562 RepID=UPI0024766BEB|nr:hypothetical protein [Streptomyces sp. LBL]